MNPNDRRRAPRPAPRCPSGAEVWAAVQTLLCARVEEIQAHLVKLGCAGATGPQVGEILWTLKQAGWVVDECGWYAPINGAPYRLVLGQAERDALERIASSLETLAYQEADDAGSKGDRGDQGVQRDAGHGEGVGGRSGNGVAAPTSRG